MDPLTIGLGLAIFAGFAYLSRKAPGQKKPDCGGAAAQNAVGTVVGQGVGGAVAGSSAGPYGAATGAGIGVALGTYGALSGPCGAEWTAAAKDGATKIARDVCHRADEIYAKITQAGGSIPGYTSLNCDQKLAATLAVAGSLGIVLPAALAVGAVAGSATRTAANLTQTHTSAGGGSVTIAGHKLF